MRLEIRSGTDRRILDAAPGTMLSQYLPELPLPCGGNGTCGKCLVLVDGVSVRACQTIVDRPMCVELPRQETLLVQEDGIGVDFPRTPRPGMGAAVDIGTTTVVLYLIDRESGEILSVQSAANDQRRFGADVISRIQHTNEHGTDEMTALIRTQIAQLLSVACREAGRDDVAELAIAGNTVMQSFYAGLDPAPIAVAPFTPPSLFGAAQDGAYLAPCVAGYVGGDITAGLMASGAYASEKPCLFLDLGTNGEIALGSRDGFTCCAAAAGPAFEGANITCGSPAVPGAICHVHLEGSTPVFETVGGAPVASICGSGLIDLLAALLELGIVDTTGRLLPPDELDDPPAALRETDDGVVYDLNEDGTVFLTDGDVRQLQLAKAAVAAGIRVLLEQAHLTIDDCETVYLAGGFGSVLNAASALKIGLLPPCAPARIRATGNSAGRGMVEWVRSDEAKKALDTIAAKCRYLELSTCAAFTEHYMDCMFFEED